MHRVTSAIVAVLLVFIGLGVPAQAGIIHDVLEQATKAKDQAINAKERAKEARDNAAEATLEAIQARLSAVEARDRALEARDTAFEIRDRIQDGVNNLNDQVRMLIQEAVEDLRSEVEQQIGERDSFSESDCIDCRDRLVSLLEPLDTILSILQEMTSLCSADVRPVTLRDVIDLINDPDRQIPCKVLVILCKAFDVQSCIVQQVQEAADALSAVRDILGEPDGMSTPSGTDVNDARSFVDAEVTACQEWLANFDELVVHRKALAKAALTIGQLGDMLSSKGEKNAAAQAGVHGYAHLQFSLNVSKKFGTTLKAVAEVAESISDLMKLNISNCVQRSTQQMILDNQEEILNLLGRRGSLLR